MKLIVKRQTPDPQCVLGELWIDDSFECFTLEPHIAEGKPRAIPAGIYELTLRWSPRFHRMMPHVENVPGFAGILIHWGNFPKDTEGCTLVGNARAVDFVAHSLAEFARLYAKLEAASVYVSGDKETEVRRVGEIQYRDFVAEAAA